MATDIANYLLRASPSFARAPIDRENYGNALARNEVQRLPQQNRAQDIAIQAGEAGLNERQVTNALGLLDRQLAAIEASPRARETATQITSTPDWQSLTSFLKLPATRVTPQDTDESIRSQAQALRQALRGAAGTPQYGEPYTGPGGSLLQKGPGGEVRPIVGREPGIASQPAAPAGYRWNATGGLDVVPGGPADTTNKPKPQTEGDKRNSLMFDSMVNAEQQIQDLMNAGKTTDTSSFGNALLGGVGLAVMQSDDYKAYEAAGLRWAANQLYLKSGATATPDEVRSTWKQYFPQPGDGPEVVARKNAARIQEMDAAAAIIGAKSPQFNTMPEFATEQEAAAAAAAGQIKSGQRIKVGGVSGVWQ